MDAIQSHAYTHSTWQLISKSLKSIEMKTKHNIISLGSALVLMVVFVSCSKEFLDRPPQSDLVDANFYKTDAQLLSGTADLYSRAWKDYCDQANWKVGDV